MAALEQLRSSGLQKNIRNYAANHSVAAVVLIGDTGPVNKNRISSDAYTHRYVPTHYRKATVIAPYAGDQQIATDNPFGDLDGDDIAEIPVGRLAVDTPSDLMQLIQRIIAYELSLIHI